MSIMLQSEQFRMFASLSISEMIFVLCFEFFKLQPHFQKS